MKNDHTELTRAGIPTHGAKGELLTRDERLLIWTARTYGVDFVYRIFELAGEVCAGRMSKRQMWEAVFDYTPPTVAKAPRREQ